MISDLYRDLRDRRLLVPAIALIVALAAVPLVLARSPEAPPSTAQTAPPEATAATPAVLAEGPGVGNYRKRLEALKRKNPFDQQFALPEPGTADITELESTPSAPPAQVTNPAAGGPDPTAGTGTASRTEPASGTEPASRPSSGGSSGSSPDSQPVKTRTQRLWYTWEVDLAFGEAGEMKRYEGVDALQLLPRPKDPVLAMLGAGTRGKRAAFMMPDGLVSIGNGAGCQPSKANCRLLRLAPGDRRSFTVDPGGGDPEVDYRLQVLRIEEKIVRRSSE